jgi:hypothetical protein
MQVPKCLPFASALVLLFQGGVACAREYHVHAGAEGGGNGPLEQPCVTIYCYQHALNGAPSTLRHSCSLRSWPWAIAASTPVRAEYTGLKAHALFHVFEHPIKPLDNRWGPEHGGGYYLSVSPSSITMEKGERQGDFVVTSHAEDGAVKTVAPTRVVPCQPRLVTFADGKATAQDAGPATLGFVYRLEKGAGTDLMAVCYVTVVNDRQHPLLK